QLRRALRAAEKETTVEVDGREVHVNHLDKVLWPERGWTKADLIEYYIKVSPYILPHLRNRPLVMVRYPDGIEGEHWFQKDAPAGAPEWIRTIHVTHEAESREIRYVVCNDLAALVWLAQMATVEIHTWSASVADVTKADLAVFDIDPQTGKFEDAADGARMVGDLLDELGIKHHLKTTGKRGAHVFVPVRPDETHAAARDFVHDAVKLLDRRHPGVIALSYSKSRRTGRIFVDYAQNSFGKTNVAPYSLRASADGTVSTPLRRDELSRADPRDYRLDNITRRLARTGDLWGNLRRDAEIGIGEAHDRLRKLSA
ncbi:MAG: non-homologous end-joining DNA ligase, partial [Armatimonadota bacterium]